MYCGVLTSCLSRLIVYRIAGNLGLPRLHQTCACMCMHVYSCTHIASIPGRVFAFITITNRRTKAKTRSGMGEASTHNDDS